MTSSILRIAVLAALGLAAGCVSASKPNPVTQMGKAMVGKPVAVAYQAFGQPSMAIGPSSDGRNGSYHWNNTRVSVDPNLSFVKQGEEYAGSTVVGVHGGATGVAPEPIYQDNYRDVGTYEHAKRIDYLCSILVMTDVRDIITSVDVAGCKDGPRG